MPINSGATVPRVNFENLRDAKIAGLYCSRIGSTELLINAEAAYARRIIIIIISLSKQN